MPGTATISASAAVAATRGSYRPWASRACPGREPGSGLAGTTALAASISSTTRSRSSGAGAAASCTSLRASVPPGTIALGAMDCAASRKAKASGPRVVTTTGWSSPGAVFGAWASRPAARA